MNNLDNIILDNKKSDIKNQKVYNSKPKNNDDGFKNLISHENEANKENKINSDENYINQPENKNDIIDVKETKKDDISKLIDDSDLDDETKDKLILLFSEDNNNNVSIKDVDRSKENKKIDISSNNENKNDNREVIIKELTSNNKENNKIGKEQTIETTISNKVQSVRENNKNILDEEFSIKQMINEKTEKKDEKKDISIKNIDNNNNVDTNKKTLINQSSNNVVSSQYSNISNDTLNHIVEKDYKINSSFNNIGNNIHNTEQNIKHNNNLHSSILEQMNASIKKNVQGDKTEFTIKLKPIELGDINIKLEFAHDGKVQTVINVEKSETLDMLQKDTKTLEKMLKDAGLNNNEFIFNQNKDNNSSSNSFEKTFNKKYDNNNYKDIDINNDFISSKIDKNIANNYHDGLLNVIV